MNPMNDLERLEYCFKIWLHDYKEEEWSYLSTREVNQLSQYHLRNFMNILRENTREGNYPFTNESNEK